MIPPGEERPVQLADTFASMYYMYYFRSMSCRRRVMGWGFRLASSVVLGVLARGGYHVVGDWQVGGGGSRAQKLLRIPAGWSHQTPSSPCTAALIFISKRNTLPAPPSTPRGTEAELIHR